MWENGIYAIQLFSDNCGNSARIFEIFMEMFILFIINQSAHLETSSEIANIKWNEYFLK